MLWWINNVLLYQKSRNLPWFGSRGNEWELPIRWVLKWACTRRGCPHWWLHLIWGVFGHIRTRSNSTKCNARIISALSSELFRNGKPRCTSWGCRARNVNLMDVLPSHSSIAIIRCEKTQINVWIENALTPAHPPESQSVFLPHWISAKITASLQTDKRSLIDFLNYY